MRYMQILILHFSQAFTLADIKHGRYYTVHRTHERQILFTFSML